MALVLAGLAGVACEPVPLLSSEATIFLQANPPFVVAHGGRSLVTAVLTEPAGTFVPDGTQVFFFTNLGTIPDRASTVDGVARVYFVADGRSGQATVRAFSGGTADGETTTIDVGNALPAVVVVTADPQRITNPRRSEIVANVFDERGNPVQNVPVHFSVAPVGTLPLEETLDSGGSPRFTDANGRAFDTLYTRRLATDPQKQVTVKATVPTAGVDPATVEVWIN